MLLKSLQHLWLLLIDNIMVVTAFSIVSVASLVVHKSVERLQLWGVPSLLVAGMEILHIYIWLVDALAVAWLCGAAVIKFCRTVSEESS